ncbi:MAG: hypothetical protein IJP29_00405 [Lachnospiraceae bacterium]|nr:hypothetical protein [Lachnospiraceae bacterium]
MIANKYSVKAISTDAVISCVLGSISVLCMLGGIAASYLYGGNGPAIVGLLGIGSLITSMCGIGFSVAAWKSQDGGFLMKRVAMFLNAIPLLLSVILYIVGWIV